MFSTWCRHFMLIILFRKRNSNQCTFHVLCSSSFLGLSNPFVCRPDCLAPACFMVTTALNFPHHHQARLHSSRIDRKNNFAKNHHLETQDTSVRSVSCGCWSLIVVFSVQYGVVGNTLNNMNLQFLLLAVSLLV